MNNIIEMRQHGNPFVRNMARYNDTYKTAWRFTNSICVWCVCVCVWP